MAFGAPGFGSMAAMYGSPGHGGPVGTARLRDPRYAYAAALLNNGTSTAPVHGLVEGAARAGQALTGAWLMRDANQEYEGRESAYQKAIADALKVGSGTPAVTRQTEDQSAYGGEGPQTQIVTPAVAPNTQAMIAALSGNKDAAPMAMQFQMQQIAAQQAAQAKAAEKIGNVREVKVGNDIRTEVLTPQGWQQYTTAPRAESVPTVNTAEGVFLKNPDGTLGARLGGAPSLVTMNLPPAGFQPGPQPNTQVFIPGGPADPAVIEAQAKARAAAQPPQPMTQDQANAALFADRMAVANAILAGTEKQGLNAVAPILGKVGLGNYLQTEEYQKYDQAKRDFINATLRKESGATITPEEFNNAEKQYFPQPGDKPEVIDQKRANRETALQSFMRTAGPQYVPKEIKDAPKVEETKNIGGKDYVKIGGKWFEK